MAHFNATHALHDVEERAQQLASGERIVPVGAAVVAVLAALATLFANHSSVSSLAQKNEAILYQSKAADQYNYYESKRIKAQVGQAFLDSGMIAAASSKTVRARMDTENADAAPVLRLAQNFETQSRDHFDKSEKYMGSYENYEVAATLFEVSIVLISITALMKNKALLVLAGAGTLVGLGFLFAGALH